MADFIPDLGHGCIATLGCQPLDCLPVLHCVHRRYKSRTSHKLGRGCLVDLTCTDYSTYVYIHVYAPCLTSRLSHMTTVSHTSMAATKACSHLPCRFTHHSSKQRDLFHIKQQQQQKRPQPIKSHLPPSTPSQPPQPSTSDSSPSQPPPPSS